MPKFFPLIDACPHIRASFNSVGAKQ